MTQPNQNPLAYATKRGRSNQLISKQKMEDLLADQPEKGE